MQMQSKLEWRFMPTTELDNEFGAQWDSLNTTCGDLPFLSAYSVLPALKQFGTGKEQLAACFVAGKLVAAAVIQRASSIKFEVFQPSQIPLGVCLITSTADVAELSSALLKALPLGTLAVDLTQLDSRLLPRPKDNNCLHTADYIETGWVELEGDFDTYWNTRGKNLRQNMRKQRNKLTEAGTQCTLQIHDSVSDVAAALVRYGALESAGWKADQGTAISADNAQGRFYFALFEAACRRGEGRVYEYSFDGKTVAMDLCLLRGDTIVVLKTAYDETVDRSLSPAFLLRQDEMQSLFEEGRIKRVEFYGRFMEWHGRWTEHKRTLYHATAFRWAILPRIQQVLRKRASQDAQPEVSAQQNTAPESAP